MGMEKRRSGQSGLELSMIGLGCWQFGGGSYWGEQSQKDVDEVVSKALDLGINYFDTAEVYNEGDSERSLGKALIGKRGQAIIGSKIAPTHLYPGQLRAHCEASLQRLQTDYIDLYMVHWAIAPLALDHYSTGMNTLLQLPDYQRAFDELSELKKEGKIHHIGISNHGVNQMKQVQETGVLPAVNQLHYNLFSRGIEDEILPYCEENGIGVIGYMPLLQGLLAGKYPTIESVKPILARTRHYHHSRGDGSRHGEEGAEAEMEIALKQIRQLAAELDVDLATLSLAWSIANPLITSTIVGSRNLQQLEKNVEGVYYRFSSDILAKLNEITEPILRKLGSNPDYWENRNNSRID